MKDTLQPTTRSLHIRILLLGAGIPTVVSLIALILVWQALPLLPTPVATHWGITGVPDGFGSPVTYFAMIILTGWVLPVAMTVPWKPATYAATSRLMVMASVWLSLFISVVAAGAVLSQRGLGSAQDAGSVGWLILLAVPIATVGALVPYILLPKTPVAVAGERVEPLLLAEGQMVAWASVAKMGHWFTVSMTVIIVAMVVSGILTALLYVLVTAVLLALLLLALSSYRVSVGEQGLLVRGYLGWPKVSVPLNQISAVDLVEVAPLQEWGGWGWRLRPGGQGVITRSGTAIQVTRADGKVVVVTAEDSATGAATLAALVDRVSSVS